MANIKDNKLLEKLIYISGSPRGGSTVFFNLFSKNKKLHGIPSMTHFYNNVVIPSKSISSRLLGLIYKIPPWHDVETISENSEILSANIEVSSYIKSSLKQKKWSGLYKGYVLSSLIYSGNYKNISKYKYWVDKSNDWRGLFWVNKNFPLAIFLFIIRDPRSVCYSIVNRGFSGKEPDAKRKEYIKLYIKYAVNLNHLYSRFLFFGLINNHKSYFTFYEDVVNNGDAVLYDLYKNVLGDKVPKDELINYMNLAKGASSHSLEKGRHHVEKGVNNSALRRWSDLDNDLLSVIEIINSDVMKNFGYKKIASTGVSNYLDIFKNIGIKNSIIFIISKVFFIISKLISVFRKVNKKRY